VYVPTKPVERLAGADGLEVSHEINRKKSTQRAASGWLLMLHMQKKSEKVVLPGTIEEHCAGKIDPNLQGLLFFSKEVL
jgi:hypothetical protein